MCTGIYRNMEDRPAQSWRRLLEEVTFDLGVFFFFFNFLKIFIGVQLLYKIVLISDVQQSESAMHIPTFLDFLPV